MDAKSLSLFVCLVLVAQVFAQNNTYQLNGVLRDQSPNTMRTCTPQGSCGTANNSWGFWGTDFELPLYSYTENEKGLVGAQCSGSATRGNWKTCGKIGDDRTPVYQFTGTSPGNNVRSKDSFNNWFHTTDQTFPWNHTITLLPKKGNTYTYVNNSFFPLDGKGWNDHCNYHNYGYCYEIHTRFGYQGGETFSFTGDDDVWVFMNDFLVIDLGALHKSMSASVSLDDIPSLVKGQTYKMDFFYCERHTTESNMEITTSLAPYCAYTDWCGYCEGNGQGCCTQDIIKKYCDDGDSCTADTCSIDTSPVLDPVRGCVHTRNNCTAPDACHSASCDATGKCTIKALNCDDGDKCTNDTCDLRIGCQNIPLNCNDNNLCTDDSCDSGFGCRYANHSCDDKNACTQDSCTPATGCSNPPITCNAGNKCLSSACDTVTGCSKANISCDDKNVCTQDSCIPAIGCSSQNISCDDGMKCTNDYCNAGTGPNSGCAHTLITCPYINACTTNVCSNTTGCVTAPVVCPIRPCYNVQCIPAQNGCVYTPFDCNDQLACTTDSCDNTTDLGTCVNKPVVCDDNSKCTDDSCDPSNGQCLFKSITCDDNNACTSNECSNSSGCVYPDIPCDDQNACTVDTCDSSSGCKYSNVSCDDSNQCTKDQCLPKIGCVWTNITCNDDNACTRDYCVPDSGCKADNISDLCEDGLPCTVDICLPSVGCTRSDLDCNDGDSCTSDSCDNDQGGCVNPPIAECTLCYNPDTSFRVNCSGYVTDPCFPWECAPINGSCVPSTPVSCDDHSDCTEDRCSNVTGKCEFIPKNCTDDDLCTIDSCNPVGGCKHDQMNCDDRSLCTNDSCVAGECVFVALCDDGNFCSNDTCDPAVGCSHTTTICNDNNACTDDSCSDSIDNCTFAPISCDQGTKCQISSCNASTGCSLVDKVCDDGNVCTEDECNLDTGDCVFTPLAGFCLACDNVPCTFTDSCFPKVCNNETLTCESRNVSCDDGEICTIDTCDGSAATPKCNYAPLPCDISDSCNPWSCISQVGCQQSHVSCAIDNLCSNSSCSPVPSGDLNYTCIHEPVSCPFTDLCHPQECNSATGQCDEKATVCNDNNLCTSDECDLATGNCTFTLNPCGDVCNPASCNVSTGDCVPNPIDCDDGNPCTDDSLQCDGVTAKCLHVAHMCDDGNTCTIDSCNATITDGSDPCQHVNLTCTASNLCKVVDYCDTKANSTEFACIEKDKECDNATDWCNPTRCDPTVGCLKDKKICDNKDIGCYIAVCIPGNSTTQNGTCALNKVSDFDTSTGHGGVLCPLLYDKTARNAAIGSGAVAGIVVGGVAAAALAGFGGKKGYEYLMAKNSPMSDVANNPLYAPSGGAGENPLFQPTS